CGASRSLCKSISNVTQFVYTRRAALVGAVLLLVLAALPAAAEESRPLRFTFGRWLQGESFGRGVFTPAGDRFLFQRNASYYAGTRFPLGPVASPGSKILSMSVAGGNPQPLCSSGDDSGDQYSALSPDGRRVAYRRFSHNTLKVGVCDLKSGRSVDFDLPADS